MTEEIRPKAGVQWELGLMLFSPKSDHIPLVLIHPVVRNERRIGNNDVYAGGFG